MIGQLALLGGSPVRNRPFPAWPTFDKSELEAVSKVLLSGVWGIGGRTVQEFEDRFAEYLGVRHGIAAANGSVTLEIALRAAGVKRGDEVILPPYTFYATMSSVLFVGAIPIFVDIAADTYCIDPGRIEEAITKRTRAIIPVHLGGHPADMDAINTLARKHGLVVIEDAAQAHGSEWRGKKAGSLGDMGSFSFQSSKNMTSGEGGIIVTDNDRYEELCGSYRNCGRKKGGAWYEHHYLGNNYRMTEFQAAVLLCQLTRLDEQTARRERNARILANLLSGIRGIEPLRNDERVTRRGYHLFIVKYRKEHFANVPKGIVIKALNAEGIPAQSGYLPLYSCPMFSRGEVDFSGFSRQAVEQFARAFPVTERAYRDEAIWIPQNVLLGDEEDMRSVVDAFEKICEKVDGLAGVSM